MDLLRICRRSPSSTRLVPCEVQDIAMSLIGSDELQLERTSGRPAVERWSHETCVPF